MVTHLDIHLKYPNGYVVVACPVSLQYFPPKSYAYHLVLPAGAHIYMISHTERAYRPVCLCAHIGRAYRPRTPADVLIRTNRPCPRMPAACIGRSAHTRPPAAHVHTGRAYRPRTPADVLIRTYRPCLRIPAAYIGRSAHTRPPAGVPTRPYQSGIRGHSGRCAHGACAIRLCLFYYSIAHTLMSFEECAL